MPRKPLSKPADADAAVLDGVADFNTAEFDDVESSLIGAADLDEPQAPAAPDISSPQWSEYVLSKFEDSETDEDGNPFVHGLRRVSRLVLGKLLVSKSRVLQAPMYLILKDIGGQGAIQAAVVEHTLVIRDEDGDSVEFTDAADVYVGNVDPEFARYATATAATRAEARAYRKALQLAKVVAAEEKTIVPFEESSANGLISPTHINFIDVLCNRNGIDVMKLINSGKKQYDRIEDIAWADAEKMSEYLSNLAKDKSKIPAEIKGYKQGWRSN